MRPSPGPSSDIHGDNDLAVELLSLLPQESVFACAAAIITPLETRLASIGAPLEATFEIGSIGKGVTSLLYQQALDCGEVSAPSRLGEYLDLGEAPAASIPLTALAQHRSGLPPQPNGPLSVARTLLRLSVGENPSKDEGVGDLLASARKVRLRGRGLSTPEFEYSNLGYALLGHALAAAAGMDYADLVAQRVGTHIDGGVFYVPVKDDPGSLDDHAIQGYSSTGRPVKPWMDIAYAPAGGIRADIAAMASFARALCEATMPGVQALEPTFSLPALTSGTQESSTPDQMGWAWITSEIEGRRIVWHNGATGGFTSWIGCDRERGSAVVLLAATNDPLDEIGERLLLRHG